MRKMDDKPTPKVNHFTFTALSARIFAGTLFFYKGVERVEKLFQPSKVTKT